MTNKQRTDLIERHIREHKYADLHSLAGHFGGSLSTVRRALDALEALPLDTLVQKRYERLRGYGAYEAA